MNVYVTGGTGFIGSYVVKELAAAGHAVTILAKNPTKVPALAALPGVRILHADMQDSAALDAAIHDCDALVHIALCWGDTGPEMIARETLASVRLLELAVNKGAKKIIYTSSTAATGYSLRATDEGSPLRPEDFYGASKGAVELFISAYARKHATPSFNIIRPGYTFGNPVVAGGSMESDGRFREICAKAKQNAPIELIKNDGTQFIWAGDLARVYKSVLDSEVKNEIFFGLSRNFVRWEEIARWVIAATGSKSEIVLQDCGRPDDPSLFVADKIDKYFALRFDSRDRLREHVGYLLAR